MTGQDTGMRLALCTIVTSRAEEMSAFYTALLGQSPEVHRDNFFLFSTTGADLALWRRSEFEAYQGPKIAENRGGAVFIELEVEDVGMEYDRILSLGFTPEEAPHTLPWGHTQFSLRDPEGNLVVLFTKPE